MPATVEFTTPTVAVVELMATGLTAGTLAHGFAATVVVVVVVAVTVVAVLDAADGVLVRFSLLDVEDVVDEEEDDESLAACANLFVSICCCCLLPAIVISCVDLLDLRPAVAALPVVVLLLRRRRLFRVGLGD